MRNARNLVRELRLWQVTWQQVETFLDQIDGAADQDGPHRRRMEGLLRVARAVEHERARQSSSSALGDPVITALPTTVYVVSDALTESIGDPWDDAKRRWRLPGADEVELAVGLLHVNDEGKIPDDHNIALAAPITVFQQLAADGTMQVLRLPSYPGPSGASIGEALNPQFGPSVKEPGSSNRVSLFSLDQRKQATLTPPGSSDTSPVASWSELCRVRRLSGRSATSGDDQVKLSTFRNGAPWGAESVTALSTIDLLAATIQALPNGAAVSAGVLAQLRPAVTNALTALGPDCDDLVAGAAMVDDDGLSDPALAELITQAGTVAGTRLAALRRIDAAAATLQAAPGSAAARAELAAGVAALHSAVLPAALFADSVEGALPIAGSPLAPELDRVISARVEYPDGTLRALRTLEAGFVASWPGYRRWFVLRHAAVLAPAMSSFRAPFLAGLSALLRAGFTGLTCEGLTLGGAGAAIGSDQIDLGQPAGLVPTLADALEAGQLGLIGGDRPAAVVVLGIEGRLGQASLHVSPLRLSTAAPAEAAGPSGTLPGGLVIGRTVPRAASVRELRRGRSDDGPGHDAPLRDALALYGRLGLLFGSDAVERWLQGVAAGTPLGTRLVPDPAPLPPTLHGTVPGYATTLIVHGLPAAFWALPGQDGVPADARAAEPRLVRPGDLVLLRGTIKGDGVSPPPQPVVQAPIEVDDVYALSGDALSRIDTSRAGVLSTSPQALPAAPATGTEGLVCGPDDPLTVVLLRRSWGREPLVSGVTLVRRFAGFDAASLAARTLLPLDLVSAMLDEPAPDVPGVGRAQEFSAALDTLDGWTRHAE